MKFDEDESITAGRMLHDAGSSFLNLFFLTCSLGLLAPPASHESTLPAVTVRSSSGALTRILNCVAGSMVGSAKGYHQHHSPTGERISRRQPVDLQTSTGPKCHFPKTAQSAPHSMSECQPRISNTQWPISRTRSLFTLYSTTWKS